ncbi:MAG: DNA replication/repair protein RecF [Pseudobdellovibrionaceae bacterium]
MFFSKLKLKNFRNLQDVSVEFSEGLNVLIGNNGQGKTNFIESLFFATQGETFRPGDSKNLVRLGEQAAFIYTQVAHQNLRHDIEVKISLEKTEYYLNQKKTTKAQLMKTFCAVVFSPESLSCIKESAEQRRNLIDESLVSFKKSNTDIISEFKKIYKMRNKMLKQHLEGQILAKELNHYLDSIEDLYVEKCMALTLSRLELLQNIKKDFNSAMQYISQNEKQELLTEYLISSQAFTLENTDLIKETVQKRLIELRPAEISSGISLVGPHKHEIRFLYDQKDSRFFCSQGQQRAIILSFKMAQVMYHRKAYGDYPVLMLDDVLSELDQIKREALVSFLHDIKTQIFVTTTDLSLPQSFHMDGIAVKTVQQGQLL